MEVQMSVHELIGNTPILKLNHLGVKDSVGIYAKLESGGVQEDRGTGERS